MLHRLLLATLLAFGALNLIGHERAEADPAKIAAINAIYTPLGGECWSGVPAEPRRPEEAEAFMNLMFEMEYCTLDIMAELANAYNELNEIVGGNGRMQIVQYDVYYVPSRTEVPSALKAAYDGKYGNIQSGIREAKSMMGMFRDYIAIAESVRDGRFGDTDDDDDLSLMPPPPPMPSR